MQYSTLHVFGFSLCNPSEARLKLDLQGLNFAESTKESLFKDSCKSSVSLYNAALERKLSPGRACIIRPGLAWSLRLQQEQCDPVLRPHAMKYLQYPCAVMTALYSGLWANPGPPTFQCSAHTRCTPSSQSGQALLYITYHRVHVVSRFG